MLEALGVHAVGFVFAPSKRRIAPEEAARVAAVLGPFVTRVGVFVDAPEDHITLVRRCRMIPLEVVVRRLATGSYLKRHPDVAEGTRFDPPLVEFFFKSDEAHDPLISREEIVARGIATAEEVEAMARIAREAFALLEAAWARQNVVLVDLKVEFGRDVRGDLLLADVIDNDSWRIWPGGRKEAQLDKQVFRELPEVTDEGLRQVLENYAEVARRTDRFLEAVG